MPPGQMPQIDAAGELFDRPGRGDFAVVENDQQIGEANDLFHLVRDVEDRQLQLVAQAFDERQYLAFACGVERGKRFVHQQESWAGEQGPADGDALLLAAGEIGRAPRQQGFDAEELDDRVEARTLFLLLGAIAEIAAHRIVGKQAGFLKHITQTPFFRRQVDTAFGIEQRLAANDDAAAVGFYESGEGVDHGRLAGAGAAEQRGDAAIGAGQPRIEREARELFLDRNLDQSTPRKRRFMRRASISEAISAARATATDNPAMRQAAASLPGICVRV